MTLPTGTDPYDPGGIELGGQVVVAKQLWSRWDFYAGLGGTWYSETELDGVIYESGRAHGFAAVEFHAADSWSIIAETNMASRLVTNIANYPAEQWYVNIAAKVDFSRMAEMTIGFTENIVDQQATVDFGAFIAFNFRF